MSGSSQLSEALIATRACTGADAGAQDVGKRKREGEDDMASLEAAVMGTRLQGFVSGGTVQPDQRTQDEGAAAAAGLCLVLH